ncbi:MAG: hypothetical protein ACD_49C00050G0031 [uncultured bacterium (gcode 4)]|uniref:Uncharacterized protein n=1 Tax=uncultured bacterium (gcode 4) TaxID=1234023 RepID=K2AX88_9BACT|nr:MAG: hypothetical protein ACD_49C00050G0031 [uncultured bacterium (gcode 4)]
MAKKTPYPYSPETKMWETLRNSSWKERDVVLRKKWVMQDAIQFNENFNEVNRAKILQEKVKDEIKKTFNWITDFSHIKALYNLMWQYPNWDVNKIKLKPNCIEFEVSKWEIIRLSIADIPGKHTWLTAFDEADKFNLYIPKMEERAKILDLIPWNNGNERILNLKKLWNFKNWNYLTNTPDNDVIDIRVFWWGKFLCINFDNPELFTSKRIDSLHIRGALK